MSVSLSKSSTAKPVVNPTYETIPHPPVRYSSFEAFYPFYLGEHAARGNRILHLTGTSIGLSTGAYAILCGVAALAVRLRRDFEDKIPKRLRPLWSAREWLRLAFAALVQGYAWAWIGHMFIEKNRPATFKYPIWSFMGDMRLWYEVMTGHRKL
ncbi:hypothetical protein F5884DRAFT_863018 [Xylogone sp. PMI_703]|nr:hypothetical protein F5884DRAFT_863018 [Xylogone sp. PMI_703]